MAVLCKVRDDSPTGNFRSSKCAANVSNYLVDVVSQKNKKKSGVQFRGVNVYSGVAAQPGRQWLSRSCTTLIGSRFLSSVRKRKDLKFTTSSRNVKNKVAYDVICPALERLVASEAFWWMSRRNGSCPLALLTWEADS